MESYEQFLERIRSFEKREVCFGNGDFRGSASIAQKVDKNNRFQRFYGDTVVFNLDDGTKKKLAEILDRIYAVAPECFCERLVSNTFHMTLHDLSNSPVLEQIAPEVFENELAVVKKAESISAQTIRMRSQFIFNMVNTSLVLGLYPVNEAEYQKLMALYSLFDDVQKLNYLLTPHITLAYYNVDGFDATSARKLERIVYALNADHMEIELDTKELFYQKFISMNEYINIISLAGIQK